MAPSQREGGGNKVSAFVCLLPCLYVAVHTSFHVAVCVCALSAYAGVCVFQSACVACVHAHTVSPGPAQCVNAGLCCVSAEISSLHCRKVV